MKKFVIVAWLVLAVVACSQKTIVLSNPRINLETTNEVKARLEKSNAADANTIAQGKIVYVNRCARCHNLKPVEKFTASEWEPILKTMIPKAHLNKNESAQVTAFVTTNAKKN